MSWKAFGHHLRAEKVFQTENTTEHWMWKRKDLIFKPASEYRGTRSEIRALLCTVIRTPAVVSEPFLWCKPEGELIQTFEQQAVCYQHHRVAGLFIQLLMEVMD